MHLRAVGLGNGAHDREAESDTAIGSDARPVAALETVEPRRKLLVADGTSVVDDAHPCMAVARARRDSYRCARRLVTGRVLHEVRHEPVDEHRLTGGRRGRERGVDVQIGVHRARGGDRALAGLVEPAGRGVLDRTGPCEHEERLHEPLRAPDGLACCAQRVDELDRVGVTAVEGHVDLHGHGGERCAQLVRSVGDELTLRVGGCVEAIEHRVDGVGQLVQLVGRPGKRDPAPLAGGRDVARGCDDPLQRPQHATGHEPGSRDRQHHEHGHEHGTPHPHVVDHLRGDCMAGLGPRVPARPREGAAHPGARSRALSVARTGRACASAGDAR